MHIHAGSNLDVKRVKYQHKNTSPTLDEKSSPQTEDLKEFVRSNAPSTSQFTAAAAAVGQEGASAFST